MDGKNGKIDLDLTLNHHTGHYDGRAALGDGRIVVVTIEQDTDAESPREWDKLGHMVCWHRRYNLGDEQPGTGPSDFARELATALGAADAIEYWEYADHGRGDWEERIDAAVQRTLDREIVAMLPLYLYDHSGLAMSTDSFVGRAHHADWDSEQVGWIYATREDVLREYECKRITRKMREQVERTLKAEVEEYDSFLRGDVYGYTVELFEASEMTYSEDDEDLYPDPDDEEPGVYLEHVDSCWGFYGYPFDYMLTEINAALEPYGVKATA